MSNANLLPVKFPAEHYRVVADQYFAAARFVECIGLCSRGLQGFPEHGPLWELLGRAYACRGAWADARRALESAALLVPLRLESRLALAEVYLQLRQPDAALTELKFLAITKECAASILPAIAHGFSRAGEHRRALQIWKRIRKSYPKMAEAHYQYALCLWTLEVKPERLFDPLQEAVILAPYEPRYKLTLANVWVELGCWNEAADVLRDVDLQTVHCPNCLYRMVGIFDHVGDERCRKACEDRLEECQNQPDKNS